VGGILTKRPRELKQEGRRPDILMEGEEKSRKRRRHGSAKVLTFGGKLTLSEQVKMSLKKS